MHRQSTSLEQQQLVMKQMEVARLAVEDAHMQHMEALCQLEENRTAALSMTSNQDLSIRNGVWKTS